MITSRKDKSFVVQTHNEHINIYKPDGESENKSNEIRLSETRDVENNQIGPIRVQMNDEGYHYFLGYYSSSLKTPQRFLLAPRSRNRSFVTAK